MTSRIAPVLTWWEARAPRERALLGMLGGVLGLALAVVAIWQPLRAARLSLSDQIARHERAILVLQEQPTLASAGAVAVPADARPLNTIVTEASAAFQLTIRRLEPEGSRVRVVLADAAFDTVVLWLEALQRDHALRVVEIDATRRPAPGMVNATLTLER